MIIKRFNAYALVGCFIFITHCYFFPKNLHPDTVSGIQKSNAKGEETQILQDRDAAIQSAIEGLKTNLGPQTEKKRFDWGKLKFWGRGNQEEEKKKVVIKDYGPVSAPPHDGNGSVTKTIKERKRMPWQNLFSVPPKSPYDTQVKRKRRERLDQFPNLDPEHVQESITETKFLMKQEFLGEGSHNLDGVVKRAISVHLPAQIAHERILLSERRIQKAFRDFFTDAELSHTQKDGTLSQGPYKSKSWRVAMKQPLFRGGVLWNTYKLEMANRDGAKKELEKVVSELVQAASNAYFEYARAWNVLQDKEAMLREASRMKNLSDEKAKANLISEIEKLNLDSLYGQVKLDIETAKQDLELARLEIQKVLELDLSDPVEVKPFYEVENLNLPEINIMNTVDSPSAEKASTEYTPSLLIDGKDLGQYIDMAYANRSDLQVEASKLRAARLTHKISTGKLLPEADLIVEFGQLGETFVTGPDSRFRGDLGTSKPDLKNEWRIGAEMSWNLSGNTAKYSFDHDQRAPSVSVFQGQQGPISDTHSFSFSVLDNLNSIADLKETKIQALEQVVELEKAERDVIREVKEAYFNYNKALIHVESTLKRMKYREKLTSLAKHRLDNNEVQISEYLQSQIDYTGERAELHRSLADFYSAKANLNKAIGVQNFLRIES